MSNEAYEKQDAFTGLTADTYTVAVVSGVPAGYTQTFDPDESGAPCVTCDGQFTVTVIEGQRSRRARIAIGHEHRAGINMRESRILANRQR